ncbi:hypothetical protein HQ619_07725 [Burkholderia gladioli]|uniref:hypothetical protein n=1 Tax=Burkholderia gladioli TaxID=28095 RepID=UPI001561358C|nr:hypothetical protein [Burkholderia gladioli]NRF83814.1 hypothetical protein [Burkholderia gladioli]
MAQLQVKVSATIANEWVGRCIRDVIPNLPDFYHGRCVLAVTPDVARKILADCEFNGDAKSGPEEMPNGARRAYRAMAKQLREALASL